MQQLPGSLRVEKLDGRCVNMTTSSRWVRLGLVPDPRGELVFAEVGTHVPFPIARIFIVRGIGRGVERGRHAHRRTSEIVFCVEGEVLVHLDDGVHQEEFILDSPANGVVVDPMVWISYKGIARSSILTVLASRPFDEADYIRNRDTFLKAV